MPRLLAAGYRVRCLVRSAPKAASRSWASHPRVEIVEAPFDNVEATAEAMRGCGAAYYLVHSMLTVGSGYRDADRAMADAFARTAARAGVTRIIYLGGLGAEALGLSEHLASLRRDRRVSRRRVRRVDPAWR